MASAPTTAPEQGQLVSVRLRQYLVTDVARSALPERRLHGLGDDQTLISPTSVEDHGLGEKIWVIWELERTSNTIWRLREFPLESPQIGLQVLGLRVKDRATPACNQSYTPAKRQTLLKRPEPWVVPHKRCPHDGGGKVAGYAYLPYGRLLTLRPAVMFSVRASTRVRPGRGGLR